MTMTRDTYRLVCLLKSLLASTELATHDNDPGHVLVSMSIEVLYSVRSIQCTYNV